MVVSGTSSDKSRALQICVRIFTLVYFFLAALLSACSEPPPQPIHSTLVNNVVANRLLSGVPSPVNNSFNLAKYENADFVKGGLLYDTWYGTNFLEAPFSPNPVWELLGHNNISAADTWRCSTCHGWDYQGVNGILGDTSNPLHSGINGVVPAIRQNTPQEIWTFIREGNVTDNNNKIASHNFIAQLSEEDIYALTKFVITVREEAIASVSPLTIINTKATIKGDQIAGATLFNRTETDSCVSCHGTTGTALAGTNIKLAATNNPAQALHRIRFGVASAKNPMPGVITTLGGNPTINLKKAGDITAFVAHGVDSNHIRGGRLYDNWIVESGIDVASLAVNPLWEIAPYPSQIPEGANLDPVESWRCVNCHTYYYEGGNGFGFNNLLNLKQLRGWTTDNGADSFIYIFDFLTNGFPALINGTVTQVHNYGQFINADPALSAGLVEADLWDLADFAVEEIINTNQFIQPDTGTAVGNIGHPVDLTIGTEYYTGINQHFGADDINCSMCHGADGLGIENVDLAALSWSDPWKFFHRTRFGTPRAPDAIQPPPFDSTATVMPGILEFTKQDGVTMSDNYDAVDVLHYIQLVLNGFTPP